MEKGGQPNEQAPSLSARHAASELLQTIDPLSDVACTALLHYGEEDDLVDFKQDFTGQNEKSWYDLAIDCVAFANTRGGFVVVGVRDRTWEKLGLSPEAVAYLNDAKKVLEKINRALVPSLTKVRTRVFTHDEKQYVLLCIPPSLDKTHVFESNLDITEAGKPPRTIVRAGSIFIRRSGSNHILTAVDFEELLARRIERFRSRILEGIGRVVAAGPDQELITVTKEVTPESAVRYRVVDASKAEGIAGATLAIAGDTVRDRVVLFIALTGANRAYEVDDRILYEAYDQRHSTEWQQAHRDWLCRAALKAGLPAFFWMKDLTTAECRGRIKEAFEIATVPIKYHLVTVSGFYGSNFYEQLRARVGNARSFPGKNSLFNVTQSSDRANDEERASDLAKGLARKIVQNDRYALEKLDASLYAPF